MMERQKKIIIRLNTSSDPESETENNTSEDAGVPPEVKADETKDEEIQDAKAEDSPDPEPEEKSEEDTTQSGAAEETTAQPADKPEPSKPDREADPDPKEAAQERHMYPGGESQTAVSSSQAEPATGEVPTTVSGRSYPEQSARYRYPDGTSSCAETSTSSSSKHPYSSGSANLGFSPAGTSDAAQPSAESAFPYLYICPAGFLTVLLKDDLAVELTLDNTIRLVNNQIKATAAISADGRLSCIHHELAKIYQAQDDVDAEIFLERRARLAADRALFASKNSCFRLAKNGIQKAKPEFADISHDMSISVLYSSSGYGPHLIDAFLDRVQSAKYYHTKNSNLLIWINGVKIFQNTDGEVTVQSGSNMIRTSSGSGRVVVETPLIRSAVDDKILIRNAHYQVDVSFSKFTVSDGRRECGFDHRQEVFIRPKPVNTQAIITNVLSALSSSRTPPAKNTLERYDCESFMANPYVYYRYLNYHKLTCNSLVYS